MDNTVKTKKLILFISGTALIGAVFFMLQRNWLIVHFAYFPFVTSNPLPQTLQTTAQHKMIKAYYFKNDRWRYEEVRVIWHDQDMALAIKHIVKQWLSTLQDVGLVAVNIMVDSVAVSTPQTEAFISFDQTLFDKEWSIARKWSVIESLCKTLQSAQVPIHTMTLLVGGTAMPDNHLDLSHPLPLEDHG